MTVRFTGYRAVMEDHHGQVIDSLWLTTLGKVRFKTTRGDRMIVYGQGGLTNFYNVHLHGRDVTLRSWTDHSRSLWVHCSCASGERA